MTLSIITVNYKVEKELFAALSSIAQKIRNVSYEVIVVENEPGIDLTSKLKKFKFVKYIRATTNLGFGGGNNLGARYAKGEFLFFLNPDTEIAKGSIGSLLKEFSKSVGIVAPLLLDKKNNLYPLQGTSKLTPTAAIFSLSFINKFWPENPVARKYWLKGVNRTKTHEVDVIPGTAFFIKRKLFEKLGGFDEKFFLYFEENDLCNRVKELGYKILMSPALSVVHLWGVSTKKGSNINKIFNQSRFYYFKKYYGIIPAYLTRFILDFNLNTLFLSLILILGLIVRANDIGRLMIFIPDQAWFYISARDMLLTGQIPLVGITSSQIWLHQGPIWTYMLAIPMFLFNFNPISGAYLSILLDLATVIAIYLVASEGISKRAGLISATLYAFSPLAIVMSRMPYHTSPIPLFVCLLVLFTLRWVKGNAMYFPAVLFCLSMLYDFELAAVVMWFALASIFAYGVFKKESWVSDLFKKKMLLICVVAFIIPLIPILIYDISNEFVQTAKYAHWVILLKIIKPIIALQLGNSDPSGMVSFLSYNFQRLLFLPNAFAALSLFAIAVGYAIFKTYKKKFQDITTNILIILFAVPFLGLMFNSVASDAYMPLLFPTIFLLVGLLLAGINERVKLVGVTLILVIVAINVYSLLSNSYFSGKGKTYGPTIYELENELVKTKAANYQYMKWYQR